MKQLDMGRLQALGRRLWPWAVPLVALLMLALVLTPAEVWRSPANDAVYQGFDPNLLFVSDKGYPFPQRGMVEVSPDSLKFTALPDSQPTVHLLTTPFKSFTAAMDVRILQGQPGSSPLRIGIWSPRTGSGYFMDFGPPPGNLVTAHTVVKGGVAQTLVGGDVIKNETLGIYFPGQLYHLEMTLDKEAGIITSHLSGREAPPSGGSMLSLVGGPDDPQYSEPVSEPVPVEGGKEYSFGGLVRLASGSDAYKMVVQWLDKDQGFLGSDNDWRTIRELSGWTEREFRATAPPQAAFARLNLGSGNGTYLLFAGLFLREAMSPTTNLLSNGDFQEGAEGWMIVDRPSSIPEVIDPHPVSLESSVIAEELPDLFVAHRLPLSLTASASSQVGIATAVLQNYTLTLPHQRGLTVKIDDARATGLLIALLALGGLLVSIRTALWVRQRRRQAAGLGSGKLFCGVSRPITLPNGALIIGVVAGIAAFLILNAALFRLGNLPFDMMAQKVWAYVAASYSPLELYHLPNLVSLAKVWGGAPYHEAIFPYHPAMAYIFTFTGWMYRLFLSQPGPLLMDTFQLEFLIKSFNVLFALADGLLIYLILRELKVGLRWSLLAGGLFLFNPAVWFSTSLWGQTHVISLFFLLASIWLAEKKHPRWAWLALALTALTRPQMLVPALLLGLVFLRRFSLRENLHAISWSIILTFLFLAPFSLALSPSLPVDILANILQIQEAGGNEPALTTVSLDAYSLWPLVTYFAEGASGLARFFHPSASPLIGELTYQRISEFLTLAVVMGVGALLLLRRRSATELGDYLPLLALGTVGFLMLKTGLAATHFLLALPFLILCRRSLSDFAYYSLVAIWTVTTLVSMFGSLGFAISNVGYLAPALHHSNNALTRFFMDLHSTDRFITLGSFANMAVLVWLGVATTQRMLETTKRAVRTNIQPAVGL